MPRRIVRDLAAGMAGAALLAGAVLAGVTVSVGTARAAAPVYRIDELQRSDAVHDWKSLHLGEIVGCRGGVVTHKFKQRFALQDPALGSEWAAIEIRGYPVYPAGIEVGDQVDLDSVYVDEYRGGTVLQYYSASSHVVRASGLDLPAPVPLSLWAIRFPAHPEDCERYAAMLVSLDEEVTIGTLDLGAHEDNYELLGGSADTAWASDYANTDIDTTYYVSTGQCYRRLTGLLQRYAYGTEWDYYQLLPRGTDDYVLCGTDVTREPGTGAAGEASAHGAWLAPARPQPFRPGGWISFGLERPAAVKLELFDVSGRRCAVLVDELCGPGMREISWDGRDSTGRPLPSGIYLVRLGGDAGALTEKICLIR